MKAKERRLRALEESAALAAQQSVQVQQQAADALDRTLYALTVLSTRILEPPTRAQNSPAECLSWLMHRTGSQGQMAGIEAFTEIVEVVKQPAHEQQDFYNTIEAVAERSGIVWREQAQERHQ